MATYAVTHSKDDDWGTKETRFKNRPSADARLDEARASGRFARLIRWEQGQPTEVLRVNEHAQP